MSLFNINTLPTATPQGTDVILGSSVLASDLLAYIAGESSPVTSGASFIRAAKTTGRGRQVSALQIKSYVEGAISIIKDTDFFAIKRDGVFYKITALDVRILAGGSSGGTLATPDNFSAIAATVDSISLDWDAVTDATSYTLQRSLNEFFTTVTTIYTGATSAYSDTGLDTTTTYYYRVKATAGGFTDSAYTSAFETPANATFDISALSGQVVAYDLSNPTGRQVGGGLLELLNDLTGHGYNYDLRDSGVASYRSAFSASGGPNNAAYTTVGSGKFWGWGAGMSQLTTSPASYYVVIKAPTLTDAKRIFYYGTVSGAANGPIISDALDAVGVYTGVDTYDYHPAAYTSQWVVMRVVVKRANTAFIRINKDPDFPISTTGIATDNPVAHFLFGNAFESTMLNDVQITETRLFNRVLTEAEDINVMNYLVAKYQINQSPKTIMAFGDSHLYGVQSGTMGVKFMDIVTNSEGFVTSNFGYSGSVMRDYGYGQTTGNNLYDYYPQFNKAKWANYYVLFEYGTNDAATWTVDSKNITTVKADYKAAIQSFLTAGFAANKIVICTPPYSTGTYVDGKLPAIVTAVQAIASELGIKLADLYTAMQGAGYNCATVSGGDGIHMNGTMHAFCATTIINAINS